MLGKGSWKREVKQRDLSRAFLGPAVTSGPHPLPLSILFPLLLLSVSGSISHKSSHLAFSFPSVTPPFSSPCFLLPNCFPMWSSLPTHCKQGFPWTRKVLLLFSPSAVSKGSELWLVIFIWHSVTVHLTNIRARYVSDTVLGICWWARDTKTYDLLELRFHWKTGIRVGIKINSYLRYSWRLIELIFEKGEEKGEAKNPSQFILCASMDSFKDQNPFTM